MRRRGGPRGSRRCRRDGAPPRRAPRAACARRAGRVRARRAGRGARGRHELTVLQVRRRPCDESLHGVRIRREDLREDLLGGLAHAPSVEPVEREQREQRILVSPVDLQRLPEERAGRPLPARFDLPLALEVEAPQLHQHVRFFAARRARGLVGGHQGLGGRAEHPARRWQRLWRGARASRWRPDRWRPRRARTLRPLAIPHGVPELHVGPCVRRVLRRAQESGAFARRVEDGERRPASLRASARRRARGPRRRARRRSRRTRGPPLPCSPRAAGPPGPAAPGPAPSG